MLAPRSPQRRPRAPRSAAAVPVSSDDPGPAPGSPRGRRQQVVEALLADILAGNFSAGERLVTDDLARRYCVSHTPIREALSTLAGVGLIDLRPNRGAVVRRLAPRDLLDLIRVRRLLECEAVRRACGRVDASQFTRLANELRRLQQEPDSADSKFVVRARQLDNELHDAIALASGNALLAAELNRLKLLFRAVRDAAWQVAGTPLHRRLLEEAGEHLAIVLAVQANDSRAARRAMSRHIRAAIRYWLPILRQRPGSESAPPRGPRLDRNSPPS